MSDAGIHVSSICIRNVCDDSVCVYTAEIHRLFVRVHNHIYMWARLTRCSRAGILILLNRGDELDANMLDQMYALVFFIDLSSR